MFCVPIALGGGDGFGGGGGVGGGGATCTPALKATSTAIESIRKWWPNPNAQPVASSIAARAHVPPGPSTSAASAGSSTTPSSFATASFSATRWALPLCATAVLPREGCNHAALSCCSRDKSGGLLRTLAFASASTRHARVIARRPTPPHARPRADDTLNHLREAPHGHAHRARTRTCYMIP